MNELVYLKNDEAVCATNSLGFDFLLWVVFSRKFTH